ncbi:hypothetical protein ACC764_39670, partial [Rhizobium ruizarguesonis]
MLGCNLPQDCRRYELLDHSPFAFLGSAYDDTLVHLYTSGVAEELESSKRASGLIGPSLLKADPLRRM